MKRTPRKEKASAAAKGNGTHGNGRGTATKAESPGPMKTYREGERFPGRVGRTWEGSEPAFPMPPKAPAGAPHVLYVIIDDIGFGWTEPFGGMIHTPNLMRLAQNGLKYVNFNTTALCSPTRACLLTGRNHHSVGMANITELATGYPGYNGRQPQNDAQIGRLLDALERTGQLDQTLIFVFVGDNGSSGEGSLQGLFNEQSVGNMAGESLAQNLARIVKFGQPGSYDHYPVGWALAGNAPFKLCKQYTHFGGTRNPMIVHWPRGTQAKGEIRAQFHHVIDIVPTILDCIGVEAPKYLNTVQQEPVEGYSLRYTFDNPEAPTTHRVQYFEMLGNRGLVQDNWKVTYHGRKPWENTSAWGFDQDREVHREDRARRF